MSEHAPSIVNLADNQLRVIALHRQKFEELADFLAGFGGPIDQMRTILNDWEREIRRERDSLIDVSAGSVTVDASRVVDAYRQVRDHLENALSLLAGLHGEVKRPPFANGDGQTVGETSDGHPRHGKESYPSGDVGD